MGQVPFGMSSLVGTSMLNENLGNSSTIDLSMNPLIKKNMTVLFNHLMSTGHLNRKL